MDNILALEEDISEDAETDTSVILDASVASRRSSSDRRIVDVLSRDDLVHTSDDSGERRQRSRAGEHVSTVSVGVAGSGNLGVVRLHNGGGEVEKGGS